MNRELAIKSIESGQSRTAVQASVYFALTFGFGVALIAPLLMREQRVGWEAALLFYSALLALHLTSPIRAGLRTEEIGWLLYDGAVFALLLCRPVRSRFAAVNSM